MKILKLAGRFLLNLITTNQQITQAGGTVNEVEKTSSFLGLNLNDLLKGLVVTVLSAVLTFLVDSWNAGQFTIDWQLIKKVALTAGGAYLLKNLGTPSKTMLKILVLGLLFASSSFAQTNSSIKALQSLNADSTTVRFLASHSTSFAGDSTTVGWMYYNKLSKKWRVYTNGVWVDLGTGGSGGTVGAANGLTKNGSNIELGGTLTKNTTIAGAFNLIIGNLSGTGTRAVTASSTGQLGTATLISPSGANGIIQLSNGTGNLTSSANLFWTSSSSIEELFIGPTSGTKNGAFFIEGKNFGGTLSSELEFVSGGSDIHMNFETSSLTDSGVINSNNGLTINTGVNPSATSNNFTVNAGNANGSIALNANGASGNVNISSGAGYDLEMGGGLAQFIFDNSTGILTLDNFAGLINIPGSSGMTLGSPGNAVIDMQTTTIQITSNGLGPFPIQFGPRGSTVQDFGSTVSLGETTIGSITLTGAATTDVCQVSAPASVGVFTCRVTGSNTISITFHNTTAAPVDPASGTYQISLTK